MALVGWWKLNGNTNDSSIYKNNGTNNGATLVDGGPLGKCYDFSNGYLSCGHISNNICIHENLTISFWVYTNNLPSSGTRRGIMQTAYGAEFAINITDNGSIQYYYGTSGSQTSPYSSTTCNNIFNVGEWHHITITVNVDTLKWTIYKDGNYITQSNMSYNPVAATSMALEIGRSYTGNFPGKLCDVRIYNHALSTKEIKELTKCKVLHYTFNQFQEPTTNILNYNTYYRCWSSDSSNACALITDRSSHSYKMIGTCNVAGAYSYVYPYYSVPIGKYFTLSMKVKNNYSKTLKTRIVIRDGSNGDYLCTYTYFYIQPNTIETIFVTTNTLNQENIITPAIACYSDDITGEVNAEIYDVQLEQKDHPTPFTSSSRTGRVYDCSGYSNNADLTESTTPKWVEGGPVGSGYYEFKQNQKIEISNIFNDKFTISFWMKSVSDKVKHVIGNANGFFSNGGGWFIGCASSAADMYFEVQAADSRTPIRFYSNRIYDWSHFVATYNSGEMKTYLNGEFKSSGFRVMNSTSNDIILGDKNISTYYMDGDLITDIRFYATDLSEDTIKEIYQSRASIDNNKNVYVNKIKEDKYVDAILDYSTWTIGTTGSQTGFSRNGLESENYIIEGQDPFGNIIPIWEARPDATSGADGGWNSDLFSIDNTKYYRFSTWVKRTVKGNGHFYLGTEGYNSANADIGVLYRSTGAVNTNPYFNVNSNWGEWESGVENKWYLVVGHIFPVNSGTGSNHPDSGVYDINGNKIKDAEADFVWQTDVVKSRHRSYLYYSTDTSTRQQWCYPRVDVCDGSEPTISDLINGVDYEHYKILKGEEKSGSIKKTGLIKVNEVNTVGPTNGLVLYMPLNGDTRDYSGNNNDGTNNGATIVQGLGNKMAYEFDGSSYISSFYDGSSVVDHDHTIIGWFKCNRILGIGGTERLTLFKDRDSWAIGIWYDNETIRAHTNGLYIDVSWYQDTNWHMIGQIFDYSDSSLKIIIDGIIYTGTETSYSASGSNNLRIAQNSNAATVGSYEGLIQDFRIYNRALSQQEISWLFDMYNPDKTIGAKIFNNNIIYAHSFKEGY